MGPAPAGRMPALVAVGMACRAGRDEAERAADEHGKRRGVPRPGQRETGLTPFAVIALVTGGPDRTLDAVGAATYLSPGLDRSDGTAVTGRTHRAGSGNGPGRRLCQPGRMDPVLSVHRAVLETTPERHSTRHLETALHSENVDDDLSMAIRAVAATDTRRRAPQRGEPIGGLVRILSETQDARAAMGAFLAIPGAAAPETSGLPDGGAEIRDGVIERWRTMIDELEHKET